MTLRSSWHLVLLGLVAAAVVAAAVLELGPPTSSARTSREVVTAAKGVVQSTVSGTGNVEPGTDVTADFQAAGTLQHVYIKTGDHVVKGQLLATLDPTAAQNTLDQAQESLTAAEDQLTNAENATVTQTTGAVPGGSSIVYAALLTSATSTTTTAPAAQTTVTVTVPAPTTTTTTTSAAAAPRTTTLPATTTATSPATTTTTTAPTAGSGSTGSGSSGARSTGSSGSGSSGSSGSGSTGASSASSASSAETEATKEANIASAQASVDGAEADVTNAETALHQTHLYAPATGTVVSVEDISIGDQVSAGSSGSGSSSAGSSSGTGSSAGTGSGTTSAGSLGSSSSGSSSSSTSTGFAEIVNTNKLTMTVSFSESDIGKIKAGQPATVTMEALTGVELGAHVTSISPLGTTSSSVVSYDATLTLDQRDSRVKPGMSATASVITGQAQGVTLPNSAVSARGSTATVNQLRNGKTVSTPVVVGLQGDSRTQIVSGLSAGDQVVVTATLPSLGTSSTGSTGSGAAGTLGGAGSALGGGGGFGGGAGGLGGGGGGFARRFGGG